VDGKLLGLGKEYGEDVAEDNKARRPDTVMGVEEQTQQRGARDFELAPGHPQDHNHPTIPFVVFRAHPNNPRHWVAIRQHQTAVSFSVVSLIMINVDPDAVVIQLNDMRMHRTAPIKTFFGLLLQPYHVVDDRLT
jgi:hypothetical protein